MRRRTSQTINRPQKRGNPIRVIACIEAPAVVKRFLAHLEHRPDSNSTRTHPARAPPAWVNS